MSACIDSLPAILRAPWRNPAEVLSALADEPYTVCLLSDGVGPRGRWSYLARSPAEPLMLSEGSHRLVGGSPLLVQSVALSTADQPSEAVESPPAPFVDAASRGDGGFDVSVQNAKAPYFLVIGLLNR